MRLVVAREDDQERRDGLGDRDDRDEDELDRPPAQARRARTAAPDSSPFGTKPRAPLAGINSP